jgi:hypothetical protein
MELIGKNDIRRKWGRTYALMSITLDNSESARVLGVLHDKPVLHISLPLLLLPSSLPFQSTIGVKMQKNSPTQTFLVIGVDLRSFLQLGNQLVDGLLVLLCVEVYDECVDHCCGVCVV